MEEPGYGGVGVKALGGKAVVIGSGVGGAAVAALLAQQGREVDLIETQSFPGGRCASTKRDGFVVNFGVHMFSRGGSGPHGEVNRMVKGDLSWINRDPPCRIMGKTEFGFPLDIRSLMRQAGVARKLGVRPSKYLGAYRLFRALMGGRDIEQNDPVTLRDYVSRYTDDEMIHLFITCVSQLYFALSYLESSAGEFIWSFTRMFNGASFGYPRGGPGDIPGSFVRAAERLGVKTHYGEPVTRILVDGGRVRGVETARSEYPVDLVKSNMGLPRTIELAGAEKFPEEYVRKAGGYTDSNAYITLKLALERKVIPYPVVFYLPDLPAEKVFAHLDAGTVPEDPYVFMPVPTNHDPELAPEGKQLVIAGTAAPSNAPDDLCNAILDRVYAKICDLFPGIDDALIWQTRSTTGDVKELTAHRAGECIGLTQTPDQVGSLRPEHRTPVEGLWLVGADAGGRGIGTEIASGSALRLAELLARSGVGA
jgi:phytoene dehydrogenase-like protein